MTGESSNWYEVEINEQNQTKKYVLKTDPLWRRTQWDYWINQGSNILIDTSISQLLDNPDGKVIDIINELGRQNVKFLRAEGEWALVRMYVNSKPVDGWIKWKNGRDLLVGCFLNNFKLPEIKKSAK